MTPRTLQVLTACASISATLASNAWSFPPVPGDGVPLEQSRNLTGFDRIEATGPYRLEITANPEFKVTASGDRNIVPILQTKIRDKTLLVFLSTEIQPQLPLVVKVSLPALEALSSSGALITSLGALRGKQIQLEVTGASSLRADDLQVTKLSAAVSGAATLELAGRADEASLMIDGASQVDATSFSSKIANIQVGNASRLGLGESGSLIGQIFGASTVIYQGTSESASRVEADLASTFLPVGPGGSPR